MIKIGIFVEGQTERIFLVKFLEEYLGGEQYFSRLEIKNLGSKGTKILTKRNFPDANYYIFIFDSAGDGNVIPALKDRAENMIINEGYHYLLAIQDLYDRPRNKKQTVIHSFKKLFSQLPYKNKIKFILAIMEIEAWFIANYDLFCRINNIATPEFIKNELNIDIVNKNPESHCHPAEVINKIYNLFDQKYKKSESQSYKIVYNIDFDFLCSDETIHRVKSWGYFIDVINESFL